MNQADRKEFEVIHSKIDQLQTDIKFIKENIKEHNIPNLNDWGMEIHDSK